MTTGEYLTPEAANQAGTYDVVGLCLDTIEGDVLIREGHEERQPLCVVTTGLVTARMQPVYSPAFVLFKGNVRALMNACGGWLEDGGHWHVGDGRAERRGA